MGTIRQRITQLFAYLRKGLKGFLYTVQKILGWFRRSFNSVRLTGLVLLAIALVAGVSGYREVHGTFDLLTFLGDFYANISAELGSIAVTVLIIDTLNARRNQQDYQKQLLQQIYSRSNDFAVDALRQIQNNDWMDLVLAQKNLHQVQWAGGVDLRGLDLQEADLRSANLQQADLTYAKLQQASLARANLQQARLFRANLQQATLFRANLQQANLRYANLQAANLTYANLQAATLDANLQGARLWYANLQQANLKNANLQAANLRSANLQAANLRSANLKGADLEDTQFDAQTLLPDAELVRDDNGVPIRDENGNDIYTPESYWTEDTDMSRYTDPEHPDFWQPDWAKENSE